MYDLIKSDEQGFEIGLYSGSQYVSKGELEKSFSFLLADFEKNITFEAFRKNVLTVVEPDAAPFENSVSANLENLIEYIYARQFIKLTKEFKTGESFGITVLFESFDKTCNYQLNFMLDSYPAVWNEIANIYYDESKAKNTDYQLFISEISKEEEGLWKLEVIISKKEGIRYYQGGRFKFFLKEGDIINFKYYEQSIFSFQAKIKRLSYNSIELEFPGLIKPDMAYTDFCR